MHPLSRFVYSSTDWTTTLPPRPWARRTATIGGSRTAAAGVPASYIVRRDQLLGLTIRFYEHEWPDVHALVVWGQAAETIDWYPDADEVDNYEVYLESPLAGTDITPSRMSDFPRALELTLEWRRTDGGVWTLEYWPEIET